MAFGPVLSSPLFTEWRNTACLTWVADSGSERGGFLIRLACFFGLGSSKCFAAQDEKDGCRQRLSQEIFGTAGECVLWAFCGRK